MMMKKITVKMNQVYSFTLEGKVPSKKNRYLIGKGSRFYIDPKVGEWIEDAGRQLLAEKLTHKYTGLPLKGQCSIEIVFHTDKKSDLDNMVSSLFDLLQKSYIVMDDRQFFELKATKEISKDKYTEVWITPS